MLISCLSGERVTLGLNGKKYICDGISVLEVLWIFKCVHILNHLLILGGPNRTKEQLHLQA